MEIKENDVLQDPVYSKTVLEMLTVANEYCLFLRMIFSILSMEFAVYECKRLFETRYGFRLVRAHSALHYLLNKEGDKGELQDFLEML